jgi:streptomycin 6-kinase
MAGVAAIEVSEQLRAAVAHLGADGERWLDALPGLVASLEADWGITRSRTLRGGNFAYVAEATTADGQPVVLKVALPPTTDGLKQELRGLQAAQGDPYVRLIEYDQARSSLLLERLGRPIGELGWPAERQMEAIVSTVARGWRPVDGDGLERGATKAEWLAEFIPRTWRKLDRPCSERSVERAIEYATERAGALDGYEPVLVHGDAHPWNVLEAPGDGPATTTEEQQFRLIDPEGLASEPAHDLGVVLRGWNDELLQKDAAAGAFARCESVSRQTGVDCDAIWRWSYIERASSGLFLLELGHRVEAQPYLDVADLLAGVTPPWA